MKYTSVKTHSVQSYDSSTTQVPEEMFAHLIRPAK